MIGFGYDSHRLERGRKLILGGAEIDSEFGCVAHSDGDALLHALCDAILGAAGLGDIGELFPDDDPRFAGADSSIFVKEAVKKINELGFKIVNVDATVILEKPKLKKFKALMKKNIADLCDISVDRANVKAKTNEGMGLIGDSEGVAVFCACQIEPK